MVTPFLKMCEKKMIKNKNDANFYCFEIHLYASF